MSKTAFSNPKIDTDLERRRVVGTSPGKVPYESTHFHRIDPSYLALKCQALNPQTLTPEMSENPSRTAKFKSNKWLMRIEIMKLWPRREWSGKRSCQQCHWIPQQRVRWVRRVDHSLAEWLLCLEIDVHQLISRNAMSYQIVLLMSCNQSWHWKIYGLIFQIESNNLTFR